MDPKVSVIMATRNRANQVSTAIQSVMAQSVASLEMIIIDDGSDDHTPEVLRRWQGDMRVRVHRNVRNRGLPAALNLGLTQARAPLVARIDDDDHWTDRDKLLAQLRWMSAHKEGVLLGTGYVDEWQREIRNPESDAAIRNQMLLRCPFCHPSVLFRKSAALEAGAYDESLPYAEDWDLWLRLGQLGMMGNLPQITLCKGRGGDTLSEQYFQRQLGMAQVFTRQHKKHYPRALRAKWLHRFNRVFFHLFPAGGRVHGLMSRMFRKTFALEG